MGQLRQAILNLKKPDVFFPLYMEVAGDMKQCGEKVDRAHKIVVSDLYLQCSEGMKRDIGMKFRLLNVTTASSGCQYKEIV